MESTIETREAVKQILSNISHEIRTPMNGVLGMIDLLQHTQLDEEQTEFLKVLQKSAAAAMTVITDILDFSRMESGEIECDTIDFDLRTTMADIRKGISIKTDRKGVTLVVSVHNLVPSRLKGDPQKLRQILNCLLENAVKFTDQGQIKVFVSFVRENLTHASLRFEVSDTGIGIEPDKIHTIFEAFSQVDGSSTRKYGGTGIGLAISKHLVQLMGGKDIAVKTAPGAGSSFTFILEFEKQSSDVRTVVSIPKTIKGRKILIIDHDAANRLMIRKFIKSWGCVSDEAAESERALEKLASSVHARQKFDIALIDMQMPGTDGETLVKQIRSNPDFKELIVIMLSSMGKRGDVARLKKIGVQGYLPNPVSSSILFDCIATALSMGHEKTNPVITRYSLIENKKQHFQILFIAPGRTVRKTVGNILNKSGFTLEIAENMIQAEAAFETCRFHLVLMEAEPLEPKIFENIRQIRKLEKKKGLEDIIIVLLADPPAEMDDGDGVNGYIPKPVTAENLVSIMEKWRLGTEDAVEKNRVAYSGADIFNFKAALERAMEDKAFLEMLLNEFIRNLPEKLAVMKEAILKKDYGAVTLHAHSLRGSAATMGAEGISRRALDLEKEGDIGDFESAHQKLTMLEDEFQRFKTHIDTIEWRDV